MMRAILSLLVAAVLVGPLQGFVPSNGKTTTQSNIKFQQESSTRRSMFYADTETTSKPNSGEQQKSQARVLGSQENLMLPRQYGPSPDKFPQMTHVCSVVLNATPSEKIFKQALQEAMSVHPLLNARIQGDGEPDKRIDLMQMVREGEPNPCTFVSSGDQPMKVEDVLTIYNNVDDEEELTRRWQTTFVEDLDDPEASWCNKEKGPLWKVEWHRPSSPNKPCALVFSLNHAISDQSSVNRFVDQILQNVASLEEKKKVVPPSKPQEMPMSVEDSVLGLSQRWSDVGPGGLSLNTVKYVLGKAAEGAKNPVILPEKAVKKEGNPLLGALTIISGKTAGGQDESSDERETTAQFRTLSKESTSQLLEQCRANGVSMSNALTAAMTLTAADFVGNESESGAGGEGRNFKVLQSLDMRRFGKALDQGETMACMAGSHDLMLGPFVDGSGKIFRETPTQRRMDKFWKLAQESKKQTETFVETNGPEEAVRVFDFAMTIADLNNLVHLTAQSKDTQGRAYSAGVTNVGVYERQQAFEREGSEGRNLLQVQHGKYKIEDLYFATPHTRSGCLYPLSCMTVNGEFKFTFHPMSPVVNEETNAKFADAFVETLEVVAKGETVESANDDDSEVVSALKNNGLPMLTAIIGATAVASHAGAYATFFQSVMEMKQNAEPADFQSALNFWIFFAVGHPILQPILWISDVLHGTPGPMVGGLVPLLFIAGNAAFIAAFNMSQQIRTSVNIAAVAAFFAYVGAGLDGTAGMGDFNLALDDPYKGQIVKGCPAYDEVRQPSMDNFDLEKYQGLWYEHKFHDWTQFKEVYDTTLGIKLTDGGRGWIDDFAVKGPAPEAAKLSWDKSPVANGAHYFLFGRVDPNDAPGILRESGFGVEFPNYIVDVQKDPSSGEYTESIQFQCLERGGVRVFEGINFMSRNPTMTNDELMAMHARAEKAGMYPYGASPEQMHTVARRPVDAGDVDNNWQAMWRAIGVDKLLELLTESIEDGGR
eukprot:CAMPEP_0172457862 /NCGR_PEP_ID=MMETSP1065-20121228/24675_1 /TAXON_ID=265537 /ORGANISM="Amphiprora paludosa, Strain CCMP125" /LENGTH=994 /DNA_ID=CAMNT_0013211833 /DNA_START=139 /DNA_END=3123 /DNA_ORIENTATION=-